MQTDSSRLAAPPHEPLSTELLLEMHRIMLLGRVLEERLIRMQKQGDGYFWIGGPGEEALNTALGLLVHKGEGLAYDYLHLHYRSSATLLAMGAEPIDALRQMKNTATDPYSGGRNFAGHASIRRWNVVPISSPIEVQYAMAPGTALAQKRYGGRGITIVQGGDAGTAEGDFASCLIWASRPGNEVPCLILVANNQYGISTPAATQHGERHISDRGKAFGMRTKTVDGLDAEIIYRELEEAMDYVRTSRRPFLLEAHVSRLHGHSSSSGANFVQGERDPLREIEDKLVARGAGSREAFDARRAELTEELRLAADKVKAEPQPEGHTIWEHVFAERDVVKQQPVPSDNHGGGRVRPLTEIS